MGEGNVYRAGVDQIDNHILEQVSRQEFERLKGLSWNTAMRNFLFKPKPADSTPFSEFIPNASSAEKKRVYERVLKKATERQNRLVTKTETTK